MYVQFKNTLIFYKNRRLIFAQNKNNPASAEVQSLKFSVNKTAASTALVQLLAPSCARTNKYLIADLTVGITVLLVKN